MTVCYQSVPLLLTIVIAGTAAAAPRAPIPDGLYDDAFWQHWGDGRAELAAYDLTFPRYGELRRGTAVTIFVTETFLTEARVKSDTSSCCADNEVPVLKLNLVEDFQTGIYDYNLMTSTFVALDGKAGLRRGAPAKIAFSSQEWCGQVYHQLLFDADGIRSTSHSYFAGEADRSERLPYPEGGLNEDSLMPWARGLAAPVLESGETIEVPFVISLARARLEHTPLRWTTARLSRGRDSETVTVPAGTIPCERLAVDSDGRRWVYWVEQAVPHRLVEWQGPGGEAGALIRSTRGKYWETHRGGDEKLLAELGLHARAARRP